MAENKEMINKVYSSVFDLPVKVSIDYGNGKDVTASIIGFTNDEGKFIVLANFDDTTKIGKMIIDELEKMRTKSIKSAEPTNALEYLEHIKNNDFNMFIATYPPIPAYNGKAKDDMFDTIKQALTTKSKKELAFDIIRKKNINVYGFITTLKANKGNLTYKQYKGIYGAFHNGFDVKLLTEEEFELLKSEVGK